MAATCTVTQETNQAKLKKGTMQRVRWQWKSHTDGSVSGVGGAAAITGRIHSARLLEATGISSDGALPSSGYDLTLVDQYGLDYLGGLGANIPNSNANALTNKLLINSMGAVVATSLAPVIANAGDTKQGIIDLLYEVL